MDRGKNIVFIVNNMFRSKVKPDLLRSLEEAPGGDKNIVSVMYTQNAYDIRSQVTKACARKPGLIIIGGGDGTLLEAINGMTDFSIPCCVFPFGTSNDYAKALGVFNLNDAVTAVRQFNLVKTDLLECLYEEGDVPKRILFCSSAGVGTVANVFKMEGNRFLTFLKRVIKDNVYILLFLINYCCGKPVPNNVEVQINNTLQVKSNRFYTCEISKVKNMGPFSATPNASVIDNKIEGFLAERFSSLWALLNEMYHAISKGKFFFKNFSDLFSDTKKEPVTDIYMITPDIPFHLHGTFIGFSPVRFRMTNDNLCFLHNKKDGDF